MAWDFAACYHFCVAEEEFAGARLGFFASPRHFQDLGIVSVRPIC
jgi:hypothetical protein